MDARLPAPSADAKSLSAALSQRIAEEIRAQRGWISFARYMELALHCPGLGYYAGGLQKFGEGGDFLTAPELTPLFGQSLAVQVAQIVKASAPVVLEIGAGTGHLAADLLLGLEALACPVERFAILELSGELRERQRATIARRAPGWLHRVEWLDALPEQFSGCALANEVLDAMPTHAVEWTADGPMEVGVALGENDAFVEQLRPAPAVLADAACQLSIEPPFRSEIPLTACAWTAEWGRRLTRGALLLIDYGLPRHEYYHPQRNRGTVRCHYRHRAHEDVFWYPGLSDITAHVEFTAIAEAAHEAGLDVLGYTSQAAFLMNCGIAELLAQRRSEDSATATTKATGAVNVLLSPNEMGELFKVMALGRGITGPLLGFARGDRLHAL